MINNFLLIQFPPKWFIGIVIFGTCIEVKADDPLTPIVPLAAKVMIFDDSGWDAMSTKGIQLFF